MPNSSIAPIKAGLDPILLTNFRRMIAEKCWLLSSKSVWNV